MISFFAYAIKKSFLCFNFLARPLNTSRLHGSIKQSKNGNHHKSHQNVPNTDIINLNSTSKQGISNNWSIYNQFLIPLLKKHVYDVNFLTRRLKNSRLNRSIKQTSKGNLHKKQQNVPDKDIINLKSAYKHRMSDIWSLYYQFFTNTAKLSNQIKSWGLSQYMLLFSGVRIQPSTSIN